MLSLEEALDALSAQVRKVKGEDRVSLVQSQGRILSQDLIAPINVPPHDNSAMDGYAVRAADVHVGVRLPVHQRIAAGQVGVPLAPGAAARIFTGAPLPPGADTVIMQEACSADDRGEFVRINKQPQRGDHVRRAGEDIAQGACVLKAGTLMTPQAIGVAASMGCTHLAVYRPLTVALMCTGDEITPPGQPLPPGGIYNTHADLFQAWLLQLGCKVEMIGPVADTREATRAALRRGASLADLVLCTGGVSVGEEDHVRAALMDDGTLTLWSIAIKPGKPLAFGRLAMADFIGLPGNPVSAWVTFALLVRPFIRACQGAPFAPARSFPLLADFSWPHPGARREFARVRLNAQGRLDLLEQQSSGALSAVFAADGLADIAAHQRVVPGQTIGYIPFAALLS